MSSTNEGSSIRAMKEILNVVWGVILALIVIAGILAIVHDNVKKREAIDKIKGLEERLSNLEKADRK